MPPPPWKNVSFISASVACVGNYIYLQWRDGNNFLQIIYLFLIIKKKNVVHKQSTHLFAHFYCAFWHITTFPSTFCFCNRAWVLISVCWRALSADVALSNCRRASTCCCCCSFRSTARGIELYNFHPLHCTARVAANICPYPRGKK